MMGLGIGCANNPQTIEYCEPVTLYEDRYIAIPDDLTAPVEVLDLPADFDLIDLGVAYKANRTRALQCNGRLAEISNITER